MSKSPEFVEDARRNIGDLLSIAFRSFVSELHEQLAVAGYPDIRPAQTSVFQYIGSQGSRVSDMAERAQMTKQGMAQLVTYLEERGYVNRVPDPRDRRAQVVRLTDKGSDVVAVGAQIIREIEATWTQQVGAQQMRELRAALEALAPS